jgi:hypothetical protein
MRPWEPVLPLLPLALLPCPEARIRGLPLWQGLSLLQQLVRRHLHLLVLVLLL